MTKISDLSDGGTLQSTDELIVVRSGGNAKAKMNTLPDMTVSQSPSVPSSSGQIFYNSTKGAVLRGQGSTSDVRLENDLGEAALTVKTGTKLIGIGTTTPTSTLDVNGTVAISGDITIEAGADLITATAGTDNIRLGEGAGDSIASGGNNNITIGKDAGTAISTGDNNIAIGSEALKSNETAIQNVAVGHNALENATTNNNVGIGASAGTSITSGVSNILIGATTGDALTDADYNVAVGTSSLSADTLGNRSTAIGHQALKTQNFISATNSDNVAVGYNAGLDLTTAQYSTFVGAFAGSNVTTGDYNTAIGRYALLSTQTGQYNTAVGVQSAQNLTSGSNNLLLGRDAGITGSPGGNITTASNTIVLGDENVANAHIQVALTVASDERDKTDFEALSFGLDFVKALEPVTYYWDKRSKYGDKTDENYNLNDQTPDGTHKEDWMDIGFKAQSVIALEEAAGHKMSDKTNLVSDLSEDGKQYGLKYEKFVPILVKAIQEQDAIIQSLTARIAKLES